MPLDPATINAITIIAKVTDGWVQTAIISIKSYRGNNPSDRVTAVRIMREAHTETRIYFGRLKIGKERDRQTEEHLSRLWSKAATECDFVDPLVSLICDELSAYWAGNNKLNEIELQEIARDMKGIVSSSYAKKRTEMAERLEDKSLREILKAFLESRPVWSFTASRILSLSSKQDLFEPLAGFEIEQIEAELMKMAKEGLLNVYKYEDDTLYRSK